MSKDTVRQLVNLLTVIFALTVNILASTLPLNGQNTGEISDRFQVYFVPAGYVFSLSNLANAAWLFCWHYNLFGLSVIVMLTLLTLLIASYLRLDVNRILV